MDLVQKVWDSREKALLAGPASSALREVPAMPGYDRLCQSWTSPLELHARVSLVMVFTAIEQ